MNTGIETFTSTDDVIFSAQSEAPAATPLALGFILAGLGLILTGDSSGR